MTNKQKYKRLSLLLLAGTLSLFIGFWVFFEGGRFYLENHRWFFHAYILSGFAMGFSTLSCSYKYDAEKARERIAKNEQELESFKKEVGELSDLELIKKHVDTPYRYDKFKILAQEICHRWRKSLDKTSV